MLTTLTLQTWMLRRGVVQYEVSAHVSDNNPSSSDTDDDSVNAALDTIIPRWDWIQLWNQSQHLLYQLLLNQQYLDAEVANELEHIR